MSRLREEPRVLLAAPGGLERDALATLVADLSPLVTDPNAADVVTRVGQTPTLHVALVVERADTDESLALLEAIKRCRPDLAVLLLSPHPTIEHATASIRRGAEDFVPIPFSPDLLRKEIDRILEATELRDRVLQLRGLVESAYGLDCIVAGSPGMRAVFDRALAAARSDTPVLITGETGTGKELIARAIHVNSARRDHPFVPVNCAALPHDLIESELFGHRRGAFSGAYVDYPGLFRSAHRGTLLLDEIGELSHGLQAKLLRVLQDGEVRAVGALQGRPVDVRIMAATNCSMPELRDGALRQDLFFRLSVLAIALPPLRDRRDDIPRLVSHFLARAKGRPGPPIVGVTPDALEMLLRYDYPGNVRELENLVHSLCAILPTDRTEIRAQDVQAWMRRQGIPLPVPALISRPELPLNLRALEGWAIRAALQATHGNKSRAAALLGISRDSLYRKLQESKAAVSESRTDS